MPSTTAEKLYPWGDSRRFYSYTRYIRNLFGTRIQKLTLDAGFSCPHRQQRGDSLGCTYCRNEAFNPSYCLPEKGIPQQLAEGIEFHANRYRRATQFLAYFQAYTNTFAPVEVLETYFQQALADERVIGLVVGTRPDCLPAPVVNLLARLAQTHTVFVELGAESMHDRSLKRVNRGHTVQATIDAVARLHSEGLRVGLHLIFGLPSETPKHMFDSLRMACALPIHSLKFHQLQILEGTAMAEEYLRTPVAFPLFTLEGYIDFLCQAIALVPPHIAVERVCAEAPPKFLIAPVWGPLRNDQILAQFERELEIRNLWQGSEYEAQPQV